MIDPIVSYPELMRMSKEDRKDVFRNVPTFRNSSVTKAIIIDINDGLHIQRRTKIMTKQITDATDVTEEATRLFERAHDRLILSASNIEEAVKKSSSKVRVAATDIAEGLKRIEKAADFDRLERYVGVLERAAVALSTLAELEKSGKLAKIAEAVKV